MSKYSVRNILSMLSLFLFLLSFSDISSNRKCKSPEGEEVDWYALFLFPKSADPTGHISYGYFDNTMDFIKYYTYEEDTFPPTMVTKYALSEEEDFNYFFWNDDMTCKDDDESHSAPASKAHAKGSLIMDSDSTVFLLHSLPRFPTRLTTGEVLTEMPSNGGEYGQHFFCISTTDEEGYKIAELLNYINIQNNKSVDKDRVNPTPNPWIQKLITNKFNSSYPDSGIHQIKSAEGVEFTFFHKNYKKLITPFDTTLRQNYEDDFFVRTWTRPELAPAQCDEYELLNVIVVNYGDIFEFVNTKEHSKWAVAKNKDICCFSDINHCESQKKRGGNIVCFENKKLANIMRNVITATDDCNYEASKFLQE